MYKPYILQYKCAKCHLTLASNHDVLRCKSFLVPWLLEAPVPDHKSCYMGMGQNPVPL